MQETGYVRFKIEPKPAPHTYPIPNKFDVSARKLRLAGMLLHEAFEYKFNKEVALSRPCIYGVFGGRFGGFKPLKHKCVGCMRCVQEYPHIMTVKPSKAYTRLGDSFWTPEAVFTVWNEASTGKIPVKGMGYKGAFGGEGFDGIWTDMSEIVRPTRDGVYGREYISTSVDIGRKSMRVDFSSSAQSPRTVEVPIPLIFDELPSSAHDSGVRTAVKNASAKLGTFYVSRENSVDESSDSRLIPIVDKNSLVRYSKRPPSIVEYEPKNSDLLEDNDKEFSSSIVIARTPLEDDTADVVCELARRGVAGVHLYSDYHGRDYSKKTRHISTALREVHQKLVAEGLRDQITIIASGGVSLAEHVPKAIISGADLVAIDTAVLVALQARFEGETRSRENCRLRARVIDPDWGTQRLVNLMAAWHDQLIEILSAMGMRDVRRLRGDIGRSMMDGELREQSFRGISWAT